MNKIGYYFFLTVFLSTFLVSLARTQSNSSTNLILILDASGSMWQKVEGEFKIVVARKVLKDLLGELPADSKVGLIAYGHRKKADCADIETIVPLAALDKAALGQKIDAIDPKGKTPITDAVKAAFESVRSKEEETTIIVVSDGLETCGGAPCEAVEEAKKAGIKFVMHVIGFDLGKENVSELECAAQAGGGLYLSANNAAELFDALKKTAVTPEVPPGRLSVKATVNGKLEDVGVRVFKAGTKEEVAFARTYSSPKTNPRIFPVPEGRYDVVVKAIRLKGDISRTLKNVEVKAEQIVEKEVDFTPGELSIKVTRNGQLSDATVNVYKARTRENVARGRTYTSANSNPKVFKITPGEYDVIIKSVEISGGIEHRFDGVAVEAGAKTEQTHDFASGTLKIGAVNNGTLVDVTVHVTNVETGKLVAKGRTYATAKTNPRTFELSPGKYRVRVGAVKLQGRPRKEVEVTVETGKIVEQIVDF